MKTCHSEYGKIESLLLKHVKDAFVDQSKISEEWNKLNYLSEPNFPNCLTEYANFVATLEKENVHLYFFPKDQETSMDSVYCRDASIITDHGVVLCNMGKEARLIEPKAAEEYYKKLGMTILGRIESPGTIEGGDVCWLDHKTLAVGHGYRTNQVGFDQLSTLLTPFDIELIQVDLPHYKGESDVFHLMSILSPVDQDKAVVYSPLMSVKFRNELLTRGYKLIEVPEEEFESMGCNVLAIAPSKCLMVLGNPVTKNRLIEAGCEVVEYQGADISVKGGGGPTCLTRPNVRVV